MLEVDGGVIQIRYSNGTTENKAFIDAEISELNSQKIGKQKVSVTYEGCTTSFEVTVIPSVVSIEVSSWPVKTVYKQGENFVVDGCIIKIKYSNDTSESKAITAAEIVGFEPQKLGSQIITVTYGGCTTSFEVTVVPFGKEGTTSVQNALKDFLSKITSGQNFKYLLIIMSVIILALLLMVRSCWNRFGNGSDPNSLEKKEQISFPQLQDSCKISTDTSRTKKWFFETTIFITASKLTQWFYL